jgi:hypothetical protein
MTMPQSLERAAEKIVDVLPDGPRIAIKRKARMVWERSQFNKADVTVIAHPKSGSTWSGCTSWIRRSRSFTWLATST